MIMIIIVIIVICLFFARFKYLHIPFNKVYNKFVIKLKITTLLTRKSYMLIV